jgi:hypothetical protein
MKGCAGVAIVSGSLILGGCSPQGTAPEHEIGRGSQSASPEAGVHSINSRSDLQAGKLRFLNALREADPQYQTIERAVMNEQNELGLILSRNVQMDDIPKLMRSILKRMASEFPGQDLTVVAYAPSNPPLKIGTARLDAQSREMTYTPARQ